MPIVAKDVRGDFTPAPEGVHQAVCCDVVDLGMVEDSFGRKHKIKIVWQLAHEEMPKGGKYIVAARYNLTLNEKSTLCKHLEAWRGQKFTMAEKQGFDVETLLGVSCQLQIIHNESEGRTYANVQSIVPLARGMQKVEAEGYVRVKDRPDYMPPADEEREAAEFARPPVEDDENIPF